MNFALVQFSNLEFYVTRLSHVTILNGKECLVKYKGGAKYAAKLIHTGTSEIKIQKLLGRLQNQKSSENNKDNRTRYSKRHNRYTSPHPVAASTPEDNKNKINVSKIAKMSVPESKIDTFLVEGPNYSTQLSENVNFRSDWQTYSNESNLGIDERTYVILEKVTVLHDFSKDQQPEEIQSFQIEENNLQLVDSNRVVNNMSNEGQVLNMSDKNVSNFQWREQSDNWQASFNTSICDQYIDHEDKQNTSNLGDQESLISNILDKQNTSNLGDQEFIPDTDISDGTSFNFATSFQNSQISLARSTVNISLLNVPKSKDGIKTATKKDFCIYCKKLVSQFARHLLSKTHQNEDDVKMVKQLAERSLCRKQLINKIRRKGNFLHNTTPEYNTGILITCRRRQVNSQNTAEDYVVCTKCQGSFSKRTIRIHYNKCAVDHKSGAREITVMGRKMSRYAHSRACDFLNDIVIPGMHDDAITRTIKYDELIIIAGNRFCEKYTLDQHVDLIRSHLRLLGRLKIAVKKINKEIDDFASIFHPQLYDPVVKGVKEVARYNQKTRIYGAPSNATTLGTLLKKCSRMLIAECIKKQNEEKKKAVEDFMTLYEDDYPTAINKKVIADQITKKREKVEKLPTREDIHKLYTYVRNTCKEAAQFLSGRFDYFSWKKLQESCLILLQMFNRRRSGEIERLYIADYMKRESVDKNVNPELFLKLSEKSREFAKRYVRVTIRGKLNRTVPVLLDAALVNWIALILKYRSDAGVDLENKYVFGVATTNKMTKCYLRACPLMRKFSLACGASMPDSLRGTKLRKHIATYTAMLGIQENQIDDLANFMGHDKQIHKGIYRVPVPFRDVTDVSQLLLAAMGADEEEDENDFNEIDNDAPITNMPLKRKTKGYVSDTSNSHADSDLISPKRRSTSPFGKTKREKWSEIEKAAVGKFFGNLNKLKKLPSLAQCSLAIQGNPELCRRKPQTLKTWIDNQRKATERQITKSHRK